MLKTACKRYVYRFACDIQSLLGYNPEEIFQIVDLKLEKKEEDWIFSQKTIFLLQPTFIF